MPQDWRNLPTLGVGLGYRPKYRADVLVGPKRIDFLEITADHYFHCPQEKLDELRLLANRYPLIPHGLDLSLGSAEGIDERYLEAFGSIVDQLRPAWWSEHLAFTQAGGVSIGHLSSLPFCEESVAVVEANVRRAKERITVPLILENITCVCPSPGGAWTEAEFLREVVERCDCGLLLDVTNVYANAVNHGFDAAEHIGLLPLDRVVQLHFVGGRWRDGEFIDSHSAPTQPEIWELLEFVLEKAPVKGVILERDEDLPPFEELLEEIERVRAIGRRCGRWT